MAGGHAHLVDPAGGGDGGDLGERGGGRAAGHTVPALLDDDRGTAWGLACRERRLHGRHPAPVASAPDGTAGAADVTRLEGAAWGG